MMSPELRHRDDFRLGQPVATGAPLDHVCPICDGEGDACTVGCFCSGAGVITTAQAAEVAKDDPDPRWRPRPLPPVPKFTGRRCHDCAFRRDSPERDRGLGTEAELVESLAGGSDFAMFFCHQGMHHGAQGYVPRQKDRSGAPIGHPICAGWLQAYKRGIP